jgi:two-component system copper resistance phosphate regulon response regulator CusR
MGFMRVLVVDDSERLRRTLARGLAAEGMVVETAADGQEALERLHVAPYDVVILDILMPRLDGIQVLRHVRAARLQTRILVLSARDQLDDRIEALNLGADDYLVKPFAFAEVKARVLALARRHFDEPSPVVTAGPLEVDTSARVVHADGQQLALTPKEYALLELLVRRQGHVMSRGAIFQQLYASDSDASDSVIEVLMSTLRSKLAAAGVANLIQTRRGFGYVIA